MSTVLEKLRGNGEPWTFREIIAALEAKDRQLDNFRATIDIKQAEIESLRAQVAALEHLVRSPSPSDMSQGPSFP